MLTIAVSSRSLFSLEDGNNIFMTEGQEAFNQYMREKEDTPLRPGSAFNLVRKLLALNSRAGVKTRLVDVVLLSRNSPDAGMRVMNSIHHHGLDIERAVFSQGADRFRYAKALRADLFLSASPADVKTAIDRGLAAATIMPQEGAADALGEEVRFAFDGDSVLFSSEADACYHEHGLEEFRSSEVAKARIPLGAGPLKLLLEKMCELQASFPAENNPVKVGLFTARGMPAHGRVLHTLRSWNINVDEGAFAAGLPKGPLLEAFGADIFFDDTKRNIDSAQDCNILGGHVPFGTGQGIVADTPPTKISESATAE